MTELLQLFLAVAIMIAFAKGMGYLSMQMNQPAVLGELFAGLLLGPTILDLFGDSSLFTNSATVTHSIIEFAEIGVLLLIFGAGLEIDLESMFEVGRPAILAGIFGVFVPVLMIAPVAVMFDYSAEKGVFIGLVLASMSTAISAQVMLELGVLKSREGLTLLGAALVDDILLILIVSLFLAINPGGVVTIEDTRAIWEVVLRMGGFLIIGSLLCWHFLPKLANRVQNTSISEGVFALALVAALLMSVAAEAIGGIAAIAGAFIAGVSMGRSRRSVVERVERSLHSVNYGLLVPLFFISIGLKANLRVIDGDILPFAMIMLVLAIISKVVGTWIGTRLGGFDNLSAIRVGFGMISRGEVGLILATLGINSGILVPDSFAVLVMVVVVTTMITPPLVRWSFTRKAEEIFARRSEPEMQM
ncbi:MAG: cation:proton antiporter [Chloroflexi bacterium]|nr:cation:proton antiporter [Chloroflexota bacterium]